MNYPEPMSTPNAEMLVSLSFESVGKWVLSTRRGNKQDESGPSPVLKMGKCSWEYNEGMSTGQSSSCNIISPCWGKKVNLLPKKKKFLFMRIVFIVW